MMEGNRKLLPILAILVVPYLPIIFDYLINPGERHYFSNFSYLSFIAGCMVVHFVGSVLFFRTRQWNTKVTIAYLCFAPLMLASMAKVAMTTIVHTYP